MLDSNETTAAETSAAATPEPLPAPATTKGPRGKSTIDVEAGWVQYDVPGQAHVIGRLSNLPQKSRDWLALRGLGMMIGASADPARLLTDLAAGTLPGLGRVAKPKAVKVLHLAIADAKVEAHKKEGVFLSHEDTLAQVAKLSKAEIDALESHPLVNKHLNKRLDRPLPSLIAASPTELEAAA